ncbi:2108_t:CDS:2 [Ambispora leptoticha]|uniref:2108_t:CDS:1 n=1 Tax=Ambispora leptoticha TaxID=144679 RepID=A0A9N9CZW1_9GLOM|nr:2108_t:CDS:2 [Ambispora leptoticha]
MFPQPNESSIRLLKHPIWIVSENPQRRDCSIYIRPADEQVDTIFFCANANLAAPLLHVWEAIWIEG